MVPIVRNLCLYQTYLQHCLENKLFGKKCLFSTHTLGNDIRKIKLAASNAYHLEDVYTGV